MQKLHERQINAVFCCFWVTAGGLIAAMRNDFFLSALLLATAPAAAQNPLGIFFRWGAFEQTEPRRCYAIAAPNAPYEGPYASVGLWPERRVGPQLYLRLSRPRRPGSAIILRIGGKPFQLVGRGANAWAPNPRADAAIVSAIRTGVTMTVESRSHSGGRFRDRYALRGAASAIDAAAFACAGKKPQ
jgi:hypothetical protein